MTVHRAFDDVDDQLLALDVLVDAGVARVLTGGGRGTALDGADRVSARWSTHARGRISIMAGGKVRARQRRARSCEQRRARGARPLASAILAHSRHHRRTELAI